MKTVLITGGFDPLHSGHIAYMRAARKLGDMLVVGVNSDAWLTRKKGKFFLPISERFEIVGSIRHVDVVIGFNDDDNSAKDAIRVVREYFPETHIVFANGGDRTATNIPEMDVNDSNLSFEFGVGGDYKMNSSSWILKNYLTSSENAV
jgi:D-beta-D-heptose 7-phosphate kinase/D-beta-D-heptose 1-phosphate adenosyltransferase